jgi:Arc/MetJ family transcription regulator
MYYLIGGDDIMRTTVDLPKKLVGEAQRLYGTKTQTATLILALQRLIDAKKIEDLRLLRGKLKLDINLTSLRKVRDRG